MSAPNSHFNVYAPTNPVMVEQRVTYERVVGVVVVPAGISTLEGLSALHGVTIQLPCMTTLYEASDVDAVYDNQETP